MVNDPEIQKVLATLNPQDRAKLEAYMKAHPAGEEVDTPDATATAELVFWPTSRDEGKMVKLDVKDVWLLLYAIEQVEEAGPFDAESYNKRYKSLSERVFKAYRGE